MHTRFSFRKTCAKFFLSNQTRPSITGPMAIDGTRGNHRGAWQLSKLTVLQTTGSQHSKLAKVAHWLLATATRMTKKIHFQIPKFWAKEHADQPTNSSWWKHLRSISKKKTSDSPTPRLVRNDWTFQREATPHPSLLHYYEKYLQFIS